MKDDFKRLEGENEELKTNNLNLMTEVMPEVYHS